MKRFQVIGGQYYFEWYGESDSLRGAKMIASKHEECWDNWQGWHKPSIYLASDCVKDDRYHCAIPDKFHGAQPVSVWDGKTWEDFAPVFGEI